MKKLILLLLFFPVFGIVAQIEENIEVLEPYVPKEIPKINIQYTFDTVISFSYIHYPKFSYDSKIIKKELKHYLSDSVYLFEWEQGLMINDYTRSNTFWLDEKDTSGDTWNKLIDYTTVTDVGTKLNSKYIKTDKARKIAGIECEEYVYDFLGNDKVHIWIPEINPFINQKDFLRLGTELFFIFELFNIRFMDMVIIPPGTGPILGMEMYDEGKLNTSIEFNHMKEEKRILNLNEFKIWVH